MHEIVSWFNSISIWNLPLANSLIDFSLRCIADPDDEVILPDPCFPTYSSVLKYTGIKPVYIALKSEHEYRMQPSDIANSITSKTKAILINSPHNPTGAVLRKKEVIQIAEIAKENDIYLISDEVYFLMIFHSRHYSPRSLSGLIFVKIPMTCTMPDLLIPNQLQGECLATVFCVPARTRNSSTTSLIC